MRFQQSILASFVPGLALAITPPNINGMSIVWSEDFEGPAGGSPSGSTWNVMDAINTNNEVQTYTTSNNNVQISGGGTIQFVPRKSPSGLWTSGRIETKDSWTPAPGKVMSIQANILLGNNPIINKQGLWPAFWALGDAMRHGTQWPAAGEIDIMEQVNGLLTGYGTVHCGSSVGGPCNEPLGRAQATAMPADGFHTWGVTIDRTNDDWTAQTITWHLDGNVYSTLTGADINDAPIWSSLAHSPLYILLNVAVGGDWPGLPNLLTLGGYGSMMEVQWVAVYSS
ncbi:glycoside hydrolase family 16 protein [Hypoxylon fragiforme]|uniref:glycoside hydrolase family 16 protein n=1 Tax=Hypoxylon fragiforme TaxID=63214 RepID=UPI0020C62AE6|nr:glycoside hydrolase family 16 protein [Hypoxylon fragiforme]KAI2605719.1 glycoside hydrolase family 16 protein [Hypoxylon fragiforme]